MFKLETIVRSKENHKTHAKFTTYAVKVDKVQFGREWLELRFTKDVPAEVKPTAYSLMFVEPDDIHIDRRNVDYPVVWIKAVKKIEALERPKEDLTQYFEQVED